MSIAKGSEWAIRNFYIDYDFEEVMFYWDYIKQKAYRKFYGETEDIFVANNNRLFNDALLYGKEITKEAYDFGKNSDVSKQNTIDSENYSLELFNRAMYLAYEAHKDQFDKGGMPYILHPLRLMFSFDTVELKIIAILHDVIEDSEVTLEQLREEGFSQVVLDALEALTKNKKENYENFIKRILNNRLATLVKIADLEDNLNITRLNILTETDFIRIKKYHDSLKILKCSVLP